MKKLFRVIKGLFRNPFVYVEDCPFHIEKEPTCIVRPYEGTFRCVKCGKEGTITELNEAQTWRCDS